MLQRRSRYANNIVAFMLQVEAEPDNIELLRKQKMQQEMKMRLEAKKLKEIEEAITKKQKEEEEKAKMEMMMKKNDGMSGIMAKMMEQQMQMMLLMINNMMEQSKLFTDEIKKLEEDRKKKDDIVRPGIHSRVGRPNVKTVHNPHQFRGPSPALVQPGSAQFQSKVRPSYKPYQYTTRAVKPDFISNGTKKKSWVSSKMSFTRLLRRSLRSGGTR